MAAAHSIQHTMQRLKKLYRKFSACNHLQWNIQQWDALPPNRSSTNTGAWWIVCEQQQDALEIASLVQACGGRVVQAPRRSIALITDHGDDCYSVEYVPAGRNRVERLNELLCWQVIVQIDVDSFV